MSDMKTRQNCGVLRDEKVSEVMLIIISPLATCTNDDHLQSAC